VLLALLVATLVSLLTAAVVLVGQASVARAKERELARQRAVAEIARRNGGVTTFGVAEAMGISVLEADRLLRGMVDDVHFTMGVDDERGVLRFWFVDQERA